MQSRFMNLLSFLGVASLHVAALALLIVPGAVEADVAHVKLILNDPATSEDLAALKAMGVEIHGKADNLAYFASVPDVAMQKIASISAIGQAVALAPADKLSYSLDLIRRILIPTDPIFECAGFTVPNHTTCPQATDLIDVYIRFFSTTSFATATAALDTLGVSYTQTQFEYGETIIGVAENQDIGPLAVLANVFYVEDVIELANLNEDAALTSKVDQIRGASPPYNLSGAGVNIGMWELSGEVRVGHNDFGNRVTQIGSGTIDFHATHVAGTIVGDGSSDSKALGMAPGATLDAYIMYGYRSAEGAMNDNAASLRVTNHSYGPKLGWHWEGGCCGDVHPYWKGDWRVDSDEDVNFGKYRYQSHTYDRVVEEKDLIIVVGAGNDRDDAAPADCNGCGVNDPSLHWEDVNCNTKAPNHCLLTCCAVHEDDGTPGGFDTMGMFSVAKNVITVGASYDSPTDHEPSVTPFSSFGPADDGRVKPDIIANGFKLLSTGYDGDSSTLVGSGTSFAAPVVTGTAALLIEHYEAENSGSAPTAATVKAILLHTAIDGGDSGPDYSFGWGLMDAEAAATLITDAVDTNSGREIIEADFDGTPDVYLRLSTAENFKVTLVWTDVAGMENRKGINDRTPALVNDLDAVVRFSGVVYHPWTLDPDNPSTGPSRTKRNAVDNVEQVFIFNGELASQLDIYTVEVSLTGALTGSSQDYTLIIDTASPRTFSSVPAVPMPALAVLTVLLFGAGLFGVARLSNLRDRGV